MAKPSKGLITLASVMVGVSVVGMPAAHAGPYWHWDSLGNAYDFSVGRNMCLDANKNTWYNNGGTVQTWSCNGWPNQQWWAFWGSSSTTIQTPGAPTGPAMCLDAWPVSGYPNGYRVSVWSCNGGNQQKWDTTQGYSIRNIAWGKCLDIYTTNVYDGAPVTLRDCNGAQGQQWPTVAWGQ